MDHPEGRADPGQCDQHRRGRHAVGDAVRPLRGTAHQPEAGGGRSDDAGLVLPAPEPPHSAVRQPEDRPGRDHGNQPGSGHARADGVPGPVQALRLDLPVRLGAGIGQDLVLHRQAAVRGSEEAVEGSRLRRQTGGVDASGRLQPAQQAAAGDGAAAQAGRLQRRHAGDGLADPADAPRQEGTGRPGRLEPVHHRLGRQRQYQPDVLRAAHRQRREGLVRLGHRPEARTAQGRVRRHHRPGRAQAPGRGDPDRPLRQRPDGAAR